MSIAVCVTCLGFGVFFAHYIPRLRKRVRRLEEKIWQLEVEEMLRSPLPD
jgi:hypothetical protein